MKRISLFAFVLWLASALHGAPYQMENLGRGVVAMRTGTSTVYVGWRLLGNDPSSVSFNVYRGATKVNASPLTTSTNLVDSGATLTVANVYTVRAVVGGVEQAASAGFTLPANAATQQYLRVPLQIPAGGTTPDGVAYTYSANDVSVGDLDGDGEYDLVVKWDPSNSKDNSQSGYTGNVYLDGYKLNGTRLWRIDLGRNIRAGAHYTQFMVYDLDGDGKAEVCCRTAPGTVSGTGQNVLLSGDSASADYRNTSGYVLSGPEYFTVFNGQTGAALATTSYVPARGTVGDWGDTYGNRVDRFISTIAYCDGVRPSVIMGRGYYTRLVRVAWDYRNGTLTQRWVFDSNTSGNSAYAGQGNHQLTVGDVDGDGKDEVVNGSSAINDNGTGLYANALGHGDAIHMTVLDPSLGGQQVWQCHEDPSQYGAFGEEFRNAQTGQPIWGYTGTGGDIGRCCAGDIDPTHPGAEVWGPRGGLFDCKGNLLSSSTPPVNFMVWWDGDTLRECLDNVTISKWDYTNHVSNSIFAPSGVASINGTKANPNLSADLFGDWREEVIWRETDNSALRIYTTTTVASNRFYTFMHDRQYREQVAQQNSAYNQPPWPSFFVGNAMTTPPTPNMYVVGGNVPPTVSITAPTNGATFTAPASVTINATASDSNGTVSSVAFYQGATLLGTDTTSPYSFSWTNVAAGTYTLTAVATDNGGATTTSLPISITVNSGGGGSVTYQAETAVLGGGTVSETTNGGYHGTGYANSSANGGTCQFNNVDGLDGGAKTLVIRAANGTTSSRSGTLTINGVSQAITFAPTGAWTTWVTQNVSVTLTSGTTNTIKFTSTGTDLGNIDEITIQ